MHYNFDEPINRKGSNSMKWNKNAMQAMCGEQDSLPLWIADMDFKACKEVLAALQAEIDLGVLGYPVQAGYEPYFRQWVAKRHNWVIDDQDIQVCQGVLTSIAFMVELQSKEREGVIVPMPAYQPFVRIVSGLHRTLLRWPMIYDQRKHTFSLDWSKLDELCSKARILIFCSPHNPTGIEFSPDDLKRVCTVAKKHDVFIICDEIHSDLSYGVHHPLVPIAEAVGVNAATCMAPSKTFNVAGEHFSVVVSKDHDLLHRLFMRMDTMFVAERSLTGNIVARACYQYGYDWLMQLIPYLEANAQFIINWLRRNVPAITMIEPHATFVSFLDCRDILPLVELDAKAHPEIYNHRLFPSGGMIGRFFGKYAHLALQDGTWFGGEEYKQFVRFNYGTQRTVVEDALERIKGAVDYLNRTYG